MIWVLISAQRPGVILTFEAATRHDADERVKRHADMMGKPREPAHWYWCPEVDMPDRSLDEEIGKLEAILRDWDGTNPSEKARYAHRLHRLRNDRTERERNA